MPRKRGSQPSDPDPRPWPWSEPSWSPKLMARRAGTWAQHPAKLSPTCRLGSETNGFKWFKAVPFWSGFYATTLNQNTNSVALGRCFPSPDLRVLRAKDSRIQSLPMYLPAQSTHSLNANNLFLGWIIKRNIFFSNSLKTPLY